MFFTLCFRFLQEYLEYHWTGTNLFFLGKSENENKLVDIKEEKKDINFMKTKINLMDDNDLEGLLLTTPVESNLITNKENNAQQLIDEDNKKDIDSSIIINDNENDN